MNKYLLVLWLGLLSGCTALPFTPDTQWDLISEVKKNTLDTDTSDGDEAFDGSPLIDKSAQKYISQVGKRLLKHARTKDLVFVVIDTDYVQGFTSYTDNEVNITRGMLNIIENEAELACLLGHEIGHRDLGHGNTKFKDRTQILDTFADQISVPIDLSSDRYDIASTQFNREHEQAADEFGALLAAKVGYDPYAFVQLFRRISRDVDNGLLTRIRKIKGSHYSLQNRANHLERFLDQRGFKGKGGTLKQDLYQSTLANLAAGREKTQTKLSAPEKKILAELATYQTELDFYKRSKRPVPVHRFIAIFDRVSVLAREHRIANLVSPSTCTHAFGQFMEESVIQRFPLWGSFRSLLSHNISQLLTTLSRVGIGFIPVVGSVSDLYELLTGKDILTDHNLTQTERVLTALGVLLGQGSNFRQIGKQILHTATQLKTISGVRSAIQSAETILTRAKNISPKFGNKYVQELPDLNGSFKEAFEGHIFKGTYQPGEILYQAQRTGQQSPGRWFSPIKPANAEHADELLNIKIWGNDATRVKIFKVKESVSGYAGKVAGGSGHHFLIPKGVPLEDVLEEIIF